MGPNARTGGRGTPETSDAATRESLFAASTRELAQLVLPELPSRAEDPGFKLETEEQEVVVEGEDAEEPDSQHQCRTENVVVAEILVVVVVEHPPCSLFIRFLKLELPNGSLPEDLECGLARANVRLLPYTSERFMGSHVYGAPLHPNLRSEE